MLDSMKLDEHCATYSRKKAVMYTTIAWIMHFINCAFLFYAIFFTDGYMDSMLAPITTHFNVSDLLAPRIMFLIATIYLSAAWLFPHAMSFMLASVFTHKYIQLSSSFEKMLDESDERRVSDSDIETFRQQHQAISMTISGFDDFLKFHNAGAFCCQLFNCVLFLYSLIFMRRTNDLVVIIMHVFWMIGVSIGLSVTAAGGIMVNHYVSTNASN